MKTNQQILKAVQCTLGETADTPFWSSFNSTKEFLKGTDYTCMLPYDYSYVSTAKAALRVIESVLKQRIAEDNHREACAMNGFNYPGVI